MTYKLSTVIVKDKHGYYAYCPELKGCQTQGETLDEVNENIKEAIELYLETMSKEELNEVLSEEILTGSYEVKVG
jgi:predicted RNase H-like HicB family nuclease